MKTECLAQIFCQDEMAPSHYFQGFLLVLLPQDSWAAEEAEEGGRGEKEEEGREGKEGMRRNSKHRMNSLLTSCWRGLPPPLLPLPSATAGR